MEIIRETRLTVPAVRERLSELTAMLDELLESEDCNMKAQVQLDIAFEEIFINIASYAYGADTGDAEIDFCVFSENGNKSLRITFADRGTPYDPLAKPDPDITKGADEREIGGLGIFMVKKSMDDIVYHYENGKNILQLEKCIS